jgi:hypothetical protein
MNNFAKELHNGCAVNSYAVQCNKQQPVDFYTRLAAEIVACAVRDWRDLIKRKRYEGADGCSFDEIRRFLNSEYCEFLMQDFEISPERILKQLEMELAEAKRKDGINDGDSKRNFNS